MKSNDRDDTVLEKNVESLLGQTYDPPRIDTKARDRIRAQLVGQARPAPIKKPARSRFVYAGATLIAAAAGVFAVAQLEKGTQTRTHAQEGTRRDRNRVELADGTVAVLGEGGTIDRIGDRRVRVSGQVYLDVATGKGHFVVETPTGKLEVLGTRFVVEAAADQTTTAVIRGKVQQKSADGDLLLHAGQQGTMRAGAAPTRAPAPRLSHLVGWAQQARIAAEGPAPKRRSGTLYARNPQWQEQDFPLPMRELGIDVVVENQVARVAVDQTFHNPRPETLEGVYRYTVPPDAALSRLAMYVDGTLQESAVVERMQARRIYEDIVYKRRDPALAEWTGAGRVDLRIFPLVGKQDKRLITAYTQALPRIYDDWTLTVPLPDLDDPVDRVSMKVRIADCGTCEIASPSHDVAVTHDGDAAVVTYQRAGETVTDSLVLTVRDPAREARVAQAKDGDWQYLLVRARPDLGGGDATEYRPRKYVILDDVSASRGALERRAQADLIDRLIDTIDEDDLIQIATMDVGVRRQGDFVRAADLDRHEVRKFLLAERGGVGATDLGVAFDEATRLLAGTDARDAYVVYLGDGVVTGGARDLAALEQKLVGKATFVGFAVGDGSDTPSLGQIADATGGLVVSIDPADDLGWRALDAVAVLYTPRVLGLKTRVVDATGATIGGADAYLRGGQLAEGDELEVAVRAPAGADVAAVEIEGTRNGASWTHRIAIASATRVSHAGYTPRLWAQRHIQSLILARNTTPAPQPCAGEPCPTIEEQRITYRETLRKDIAALGKKFFLLSPHTSLIVLENDAMYLEYGVTKGKNDTWAPYQTPATIPVTQPAATSSLPVDDVAIVRTPVQPFYSYDGWSRGNGLEGDFRFASGRIAGGSGTGQGFGLDDSTLLLRGEVAPDPDQPASGPVAVQKPMAGGEYKQEEATKTTDSGGNDNGRIVMVPTVPAESEHAAMDEMNELTVVTTAALADRSSGWEVGEKNAKGKSAERRRWSGDGLRANDYQQAWGGQAYPVAWNYSSDYRLDDLTGFVPAFFASPLDAAVAELRAASGGVRGSVDDKARALLSAARTALPAGTYRWGDGAEITVDRAGHMSWRVVSELGLVEVDTFDGVTLRRRYDELGIQVERKLGHAAPALLVSMLPLMVADPDQLAHWYVVTARDADTVALAPAHAPDKATLELDFDADHHLIAVRTGAGDELVTIRWDRGEPIGASVTGASIPVAYVATSVTDAIAAAGAAPADVVTVALPLRAPAHWRNLRTEMTAGTDEWRQATRNLMASLAATEDSNGVVAALRELRASGGLAAGDLALASGGLARGTTDAELVELLSGPGDAGRVVGRYLSASRAHGKRPKPGQFAALPADGLVGALAHHRETLALLEAGKIERALTALRAVHGGGILNVVAAAQISQYSYQDARAADAWDAVADGAWTNVARYEAARARYNRGDYAGAATRFVELMTSFDPAAMPVVIDWTAKSAVTSSSRGQVGWGLAWTAYRNRILDAGDTGEVMSLLQGAMQIGETDVDRILGRAAELAAGDPDALAQIVTMALALGQVDRAAPLLEVALAQTPTPALHRLAANVAERQGLIASAADHLDQALGLDGGGPVALSQLRADMQHLLALRGRIALLATGADRERALDAALAVSDRWREVDPDYGAIDTQIGELLLAGGRREEAWRQLSTAIERHPMEGDGWALVAGVMEREGRLDDAIGHWQQAIVIDQTNPTWRMRKAQALLAVGRDDDARDLLKDITGRKWHDRWSGVVYQVQQMVAQMPKP